MAKKNKNKTSERDWVLWLILIAIIIWAAWFFVSSELSQPTLSDEDIVSELYALLLKGDKSNAALEETLKWDTFPSFSLNMTDNESKEFSARLDEIKKARDEAMMQMKDDFENIYSFIKTYYKQLTRKMGKEFVDKQIEELEAMKLMWEEYEKRK